MALPAWTLALRCPCCPPRPRVHTPAVHPQPWTVLFLGALPGAVCIVLTAARPRPADGEPCCGGGRGSARELFRRGRQRLGGPGPSAEGRALWPVPPGCRSGRRGRPPGARVCAHVGTVTGKECFADPQAKGLPHLPACYILVCVGKLGFLTEASGFWTRDVLPQGPNCGGCDCDEHEERILRVSWCSRPLAWGSVWGADLGLCELNKQACSLAKPLSENFSVWSEARD